MTIEVKATTVAVLYRDAKTNELDKRTVLLH